MSGKSVPAGKWKLRPFDPKCKTFVDPDPVVVGQIEALLGNEWTGNFDELIPEVTGGKVAFSELPLVPYHAVGQYVIRAAQSGGRKGTAAHTIVKCPQLSPVVDDAQYAWAADNLKEEHWQILEACETKRFLNRAAAQSEETITAYVVGTGNRPARGVLPDMKRQFNLLKDRGLIMREKGVGTWLSQQGLRLLEARKANQKRFRVV